MFGIRQKLSLGFGGLLGIIVILGLQSVTLLNELGGSIDVILRENYRSVIACQQMKEAIERIDSGILFTLLGYEWEGSKVVRENEVAFEKALHVELQNITLPGEKEKAAHLQGLFTKYTSVLESAVYTGAQNDVRREAYLSQLSPLCQQIKAAADDILSMNQQNMTDANQLAKQTAADAQRRMFIFLVLGVGMAIGFVFFAGRWIFRPIDRLIASTHEIRAGNLDLVVQADTRDEIGALSEAFNSMTASLRSVRRTDRTRLARIQRSTEQAFKFLPDAIAIVDLEANVEIASEAASQIFHLKLHQNLKGFVSPQVMVLLDQAIGTGRAAETQAGEFLIQKFVEGEERYYRPKVVPILDTDKQPIGAIVILSDITQEHHQNELKRGLISTVSHQLRTPLTSVRMALHMLLEEKVGPLNAKQEELVISARDESERLESILEKLLSIRRVESGKALIDLQVIAPQQLVFDSVDPFHRAAQDRGIALNVDLLDDLPDVIADPHLIGQVFANLVSNALKYTDPGGRISVSAHSTENYVIFSVTDTGKGIPTQYRERILEQFFRVPGQAGDTGVGLGLSIVQEMVAAHGGAIDLESREGEGSRFTFSLPRANDKGNIEGIL